MYQLGKLGPTSTEAAWQNLPAHAQAPRSCRAGGSGDAGRIRMVPLCSETHVFNCTCRCKPIRIRLYPEARHMTCISELPRRAWMYEAILSA